MKMSKMFSGLLMAAVAMPFYAHAENFSMWARSDDSNFLPSLVKAFNAKDKDHVDLQLVPVNELVQKYGIAAAGGSAPDALSLDLIYTPSFALAGQLKDVTKFAHSLPYFDHLSKAHLSVGTVDSKVYGMPFSADASFLIWNKDLFKKAGLNPDKGPKTWAEIRKDAEAVNKLGKDTYGFYFSGNCGGCNIFTFAPLVWASGGSILTNNGAKATLDTSQMRDAVNFYRSMVKDGLVPPGSQTDSGANFFAAFAKGNIGITPSGAFAIGALNTQYPNLHYGVTYLPGKDGKWSSFAGGDNIVISNGTSAAKVKAVEHFIEFVYSLEGQKIMASHGSLPVRSDIAEKALAGLDARYLVGAKAMAAGKTPFSPVFNDLINSANGPWITTLNNAFFGKSDNIGQILDEGQKKMQSIIDNAN